MLACMRDRNMLLFSNVRDYLGRDDRRIADYFWRALPGAWERFLDKAPKQFRPQLLAGAHAMLDARLRQVEQDEAEDEAQDAQDEAA